MLPHYLSTGVEEEYPSSFTTGMIVALAERDTITFQFHEIQNEVK